jgi:hypothetical protein
MQVCVTVNLFYARVIKALATVTLFKDFRSYDTKFIAKRVCYA